MAKLVEEDLSTPQRMKVYLSNIKDKIERAAQEETGQKQKVKIIVVVRAHEDTRSGKIIQVLDACQKAGYEDLQLRVITKARRLKVRQQHGPCTRNRASTTTTRGGGGVNLSLIITPMLDMAFSAHRVFHH